MRVYMVSPPPVYLHEYSSFLGDAPLGSRVSPPLVSLVSVSLFLCIVF